MEPSHHLGTTLLGVVLGLVVLGAAGYGGYRYYLLNEAFKASHEQVAALTENLASAEASSTALGDQLIAAQQANDAFERQIGQISNTVGALTQLSKTDPELLKKYSKVYFLSDNYVPAALTAINEKYLFDQNKPEKFEASAYSFLSNMMDAAAQGGADLRIISAYRSFGTQAVLKSSYKMTYGTGANAFSADQGYSEHQLGTALDFTTPALGAGFDKFAASASYSWLNSNAYKYGFVLSYPKGNTYYQFEPWHWRFVGTKLALMLHTEGKNFYDLDQRTIDAYLISIFN